MGEMVSDWRAHAAASELAKLVGQLRPGELDTWLDSATPRLPETVRVNPCRPDVEWTCTELLEMGATPIEWFTGRGGAYTMPWEKAKCPDEELRSKIQALHATGRITQQEAASMMPVQALDVQPNHRVLDLCAAPGSKATQIAEVLDGSGLVVVNEPNPGRANHLVSNTQRSGHLNMVVVREDGRHFPRVAEPGFDRILVDAPCTGSGTTRKNTDVWRKWKPLHGEQMSRLQAGILSRGALLLRPGGRLVYSTCSIDPQEN
ncbi:MAG: RsmB/NOP family class I SAM-dependent RNA methyltransferase, partial [Candidatus Thermoplasmatota archaeon]|nr:RsmB/NOP family class I SAM-dependent RNA methyltransferase [Candidatus Thermoplasmatota archaeon]